MQHQELLENYLRLLKLPTFLENYQICAQDAARTDLPYERYLLALCEAEMAQRETNRIERAILSARFPVLKELSSYDFSAVPHLPKARVLELAQGEYLSKAETILLIGNPGLGNTRPTYYPYRTDHACARRNGDGGRSAPPALWAYPAVCRHR